MDFKPVLEVVSSLLNFEKKNIKKCNSFRWRVGNRWPVAELSPWSHWIWATDMGLWQQALLPCLNGEIQQQQLGPSTHFCTCLCPELGHSGLQPEKVASHCFMLTSIFRWKKKPFYSIGDYKKKNYTIYFVGINWIVMLSQLLLFSIDLKAAFLVAQGKYLVHLRFCSGPKSMHAALKKSVQDYLHIITKKLKRRNFFLSISHTFTLPTVYKGTEFLVKTSFIFHHFSRNETLVQWETQSTGTNYKGRKEIFLMTYC